MSQIINGHNYHGKVRTIKIDDYPDKLMFFHEDISETVQLRLDHFFTKERETISWIKNQYSILGLERLHNSDSLFIKRQ